MAKGEWAKVAEWVIDRRRSYKWQTAVMTSNIAGQEDVIITEAMVAWAAEAERALDGIPDPEEWVRRVRALVNCVEDLQSWLDGTSFDLLTAPFCRVADPLYQSLAAVREAEGK